jgi:5-methylcytosine-specific restriction endonuclease McrA
VTEWTVRTSPSAVRYAVWKRDHGVCAECGTDTTARERAERESRGRTWYESWGIRAKWDADHIVAVWRGGGLAGLDGYQTLCRPCHSAKTAREAAERAALRRPVDRQEAFAI